MAKAADSDTEQRQWRRSGEWGIAPPYGAYRGEYSSYEQAQFGAMGSGSLGGWSAEGWGGSFDAPSPTEAELEQERLRLRTDETSAAALEDEQRS